MDLNTPRMSRAAKKAETREKLLAAAREVFEAKGYYAATIEEIVERAGFTRGAFYANWSDKADVLWEVASAADTAEFEGLQPALEAASLDEKMAVFQAWFDAMFRPRPLQDAVNELLASLGDTPEGRARRSEAYARERRSIVPVLQHIEAALGLQLPIPYEHFAAMGIAIGQGIFMQHHVDPEAIPSSLFGDAQAYLWFGVFAAMTSEDFSPRSGTRPEPS